ncbi:phosphatidylserine decarboxylase [Flavobacteriaceae bacterium Ap0902]|nr:phosphatidylserine decarboxylase [Flavobacteriaceae bacterium Ap0902]
MKYAKAKKLWIITIIIVLLLGLALYPVGSQTPIQYVDRETGEMKIENVAGEDWLTWLYHNPVGEATLWALAKRKILSSMYGDMMDKPSSAGKIEPFITDYDIDMQIAEQQDFENFNDFFTRKLKQNARPIDTISTVVVSPADGKVLAYSHLDNQDFIVKGYKFNVSSFLDNPTLASQYEDGSLLIIRLAPPDYHRYHFPVSGEIIMNHQIDGDYYSVNPIALRERVEIFWLNKREYTVINNPIFGNVVMAEVGATMVGSMVQTFEDSIIKKGEEKGYFKFGGSTVVLLFEKNKIKIDQDLLNNTSKGLETTIRMGEKIAEKQ